MSYVDRDERILDDMLIELDALVRSEDNHSICICKDSKFIMRYKESVMAKRLECKNADAFADRYLCQYNNRDLDVYNIRKCRQQMDAVVYRRVMDSAVRRRRKTLERFEHAKKNSDNMKAQLNHIEEFGCLSE